MRYVWLAIVIASAVPLVFAAWLANPIVFLILGADRWLEQVAQLRPYRWWILLGIVVCATSIAVYRVRYG